MLALLAPGQPPHPPPKGRAGAPGVSPRVAEEIDREVNRRLLPRRKERRDEALSRVGPHALGFTQEYGEAGVNALLNCDPDTGRRLVELHDSGELAKVPRPHLLVAVVARYGEGVGAFVAERHADLADPAACELFCREPEEYVHAMKDLKRQAQLRAAKAAPPPEAPPWWKDWRNFAYAAVGVGAAGLLLKALRRRQTGGDLTCR
jgi:hypothetical protein